MKPYQKQPLDDSLAIKQIWQWLLNLDKQGSEAQDEITSLDDRLKYIATKLFGLNTNKTTNITVGSSTPSTPTPSVIQIYDRDISTAKDATVEVGYFSITANEALSFDVVVHDMESSNSFAGWFRIECYANDTAGAWQLVPARGYTGVAASQEFAVEIKVDSSTCYVRVRKLIA